MNNFIYPLSFKLPLCWLHSLTPVTSLSMLSMLSMLPGILSLTVAIHLKSIGYKSIYTRYLSSCLFVGCTLSPRSHSYLCSRGFVPLPSRCILKSIGYIKFKSNRYNHLYTAYLYKQRKDIKFIYPSSFKLPLCWLHSLTLVTSLSMLPGIRSLAAAMHLEIYWVYNSLLF